MEKVFIKGDYITLGQFVKYKNLASSGSDSKIFISENDISVNNELEKRRGRKLHINDIVVINGKSYLICLLKK